MNGPEERLNRFNSARRKILVVGAGFAGATAARYLAERMDASHEQVLLVETQQGSSRRTKCGEGVSSETFAEIGVTPRQNWICSDVAKIKLVMPSGETCHLLCRGHTLDKRRVLLDLALEAERSGATVLTSTRLTKLDRATNECSLLVTDVGGSVEASVRPDVVIGCDGASSVVARSSGLSQGASRGGSTLGLEYRVRDYAMDRGRLHDFCPDTLTFVFPENRDIEYGWVFPKGAGRINAGIAIANQPKKRKPLELLDDFLAEFGIRGTREEIVSGEIPRRALSRTFAQGVLLAGDAAGQTNPITYGGNHVAALAGRLAAETSLKAVRKGDASASALGEYQEKCRATRMYDPCLGEAAEIFYGPDSLEKLNYLGHLLAGSNILSRQGIEKIIWRMWKGTAAGGGRAPLSLRELRTIDKALRICVKIGW